MIARPETRLLLQADTPIPNGQTVTIVSAFDTTDFSKIIGVLRADQALTVNVYQGSGVDPTSMETVTQESVNADTSEGGGVAFDLPIAGAISRIDAVNTSGSDATLRAYVAMKSM